MRSTTAFTLSPLRESTRDMTESYDGQRNVLGIRRRLQTYDLACRADLAGKVDQVDVL